MTTSYYFDPDNDFRLWVFAQGFDGTLEPPASYATSATYTDGAESVAVGDITGVGRADVVLGLGGLGVQVFPQDASGTLGAPGGMTHKWLAPSSDGGSAVTGYRIYRATVSAGEVCLVSAGPTATSYADKTATKGVRYYYWVTAVNVLGVGQPSSEANAVAK